MSDLNIVYATHNTEYGNTITLRVSDPLPWGEAVELWNKYDAERRLDARHKVLRKFNVATSAARLPVTAFSVRSADDPMWPSESPKSLVRVGISQRVI